MFRVPSAALWFKILSLRLTHLACFSHFLLPSRVDYFSRRRFHSWQQEYQTRSPGGNRLSCEVNEFFFVIAKCCEWRLLTFVCHHEQMLSKKNSRFIKKFLPGIANSFLSHPKEDQNDVKNTRKHRRRRILSTTKTEIPEIFLITKNFY